MESSSVFTQLMFYPVLLKTSSSPSLPTYILVKDELFFPVLLNLFLLMMDELSRDTDNLISSRWGR